MSCHEKPEAVEKVEVCDMMLSSGGLMVFIKHIIREQVIFLAICMWLIYSSEDCI